MVDVNRRLANSRGVHVVAIDGIVVAYTPHNTAFHALLKNQDKSLTDTFIT